jgi:putative phosphoesterase
LLNTLIDTGYFDAVVHGHSHNKGTQQRGKTLVINPGELCGYLTGKVSFALLDTERKEAKIVEL